MPRCWHKLSAGRFVEINGRAFDARPPSKNHVDTKNQGYFKLSMHSKRSIFKIIFKSELHLGEKRNTEVEDYERVNVYKLQLQSFINCSKMKDMDK